MSTKNRSITQLLRKKGYSQERKQAILDDWIAEWRRDTTSIVAQLDDAESTGNWNKVHNATKQLATGANKRLDSLPRVIAAMNQNAGTEDDNQDQQV
ncbi:hypothetical protein [Xanthomonas albilineans]|uniref:Uncharacterized protein n=1 Tax=Xanthomonas albilineans (strain GPE PC73 / CFBP 7063) TaxID=380358 RepID=D2UAM6_XANAP|nr:hypothetical protein [Xanthomonas albilineans]CBA14783.1 hypothetical protein XALC_0238 [Xanthomonas albilineans GPE PC73]